MKARQASKLGKRINRNEVEIYELMELKFQGIGFPHGIVGSNVSFHSYLSWVSPPRAGFPVAMRVRATPVPIPNTMVKLNAADDTILETIWESRWLPDLLIMTLPMAVRLYTQATNIFDRSGL